MNDWDAFVRRFYTLQPAQQQAEWTALSPSQREAFEAARARLSTPQAQSPDRPAPSRRSAVAITLAVVAILPLFIAGGVVLSNSQRRGSSPVEPAQTEGGEQSQAEQKPIVEAEFERDRSQINTLLSAADQELAAGRLAMAREMSSALRTRLQKYRDTLGAVPVSAPWTRLKEIEAAITRREKVLRGIELASAVASNKAKCDTPLEVSNAWKELREVVRSDPEWGRALTLTASLERCRAAAERTFSRSIQAVMIAQRSAMAEKMERLFLDQGMDVRVSLQGSSKTTIRFQWVLFSRATAHQLTEGGSMREGTLLHNLQKTGFRKVVFSDGYDESWSYTLEPPKETEGGKTVLRSLGLSDPLRLPP